MKRMKKLFGVLLVMAITLTMLIGTSVMAFAEDETYTLTLTDTVADHTYEIYQVFTGDLSTDKDGNKILSNLEWGDGVSYTGTPSAAQDVGDALSEKTLSVDDFKNQLTLTTPFKTVQSAEGSTVVADLPAGYYLIKDQDGSQADKHGAYTEIMLQIVDNVSPAVKAGVPTIEKKVKDKNDTTGVETEWQDSADYDIGDIIPYQITGTVGDNTEYYKTYKYIITDTMTAGLTYKSDAKITLDGVDVTSSFTENVVPGDDGTTVTWTCEDLKALGTLTPNSKVIVTYNCELNENAVLGSAGNPNTVGLTFSNNPNVGHEGETGKTPDDTNIVFTYKVVVNKVDKADKPLPNAGFTLQKKMADGTWTDVKKIEAGAGTTFEFKGLDDGDYKLIESEVPDGYNKTDDIEFTITAEHEVLADLPKLTSLSGDATSGTAEFAIDMEKGSLTTKVINTKGSSLPVTGGIGTRMFYVIGAILVLGAGVLLVTRKRMSK